ncbi:MAG: DNA methyltransferase [Fusobacteriaceae bacterium]
MKNILEKNCDNRLEILKEQFPECFDRDGNLNIQKFQEIVEPSNKLFKDSYGLNWLGKTYARKLSQLPISTVLSEDKEHNEKEENKNSENVYIKGDNLEVLRHLISAYSEKVKMIYIDPPYNTINGDFVYNDDRSFTEKELDKLIAINAIEENEKERILLWIDRKSSSHSAWLTFMFPRLYLARKLLREDGVIFISIDDNEASQLKLLCDEVFGEENLIKDFVINTAEGGGQAKYVYNGHEYLYCYAKNESKFDNLKKPKDIRGKIIDLNGEEYWIQEDAIRREHGKYGNLLYEEILEYKDQAYKIKIDKGIENGIYRLLKKEKGHIIGKLRKISEDYSKFHSMMKHLNKYGNEEICKVLEEEKAIFSTTKPLSLIKEVVLSATYRTKNYLILDFFSGSATTAHAVMQLNAEDGGNRKYIMVQLEEEIEEGKEAYKFCKENNLPTNITSIGIERIKRAAKKIKEETKAEIDYGFKIYSVKDIPNTIIESMEKFDPSTLKLFEPKLLTEDEKVAILTTYKVFDGNVLNENLEIINLGDSLGYKIGNILYLIDEIKSSSLIKTIVEKLDSDKNFTINKIVVYGYTQLSGKYRTELKENIKTYANKKSAIIDVEVRY